MGLKVLNPLIKAVSKKAYVAPKMEVRTLESFGLTMEQLTGDVINISSKAKTNGIKYYGSLDEILKETNNIPKMSECQQTDLWKVVNDSSIMMRELQTYGKYKNQIYVMSRYKSEIESLQGKELENFLLKYPSVEEYANGYLEKTILKTKEILSKIPETTQEYFLWRGIRLHDNPRIEEKQFNEIIKNAKIGDIICPDYAGAYTTGIPDIVPTYLRKSEYLRPDARAVLMKIIVKPRNKITSIGTEKPEQVMLPPMPRYKVLAKQHIPDKNYKEYNMLDTELYTLEYIPPKYLL